MIARLVLLLTLVAMLALPSTAGAEPIWDCTDVPFRVTPFSCFAYNTAEGVVEQLPPH